MAVQLLVPYFADDIWDTPDDGKRYEVVDGVMYVSPPPVPDHQYAVTWLVVLVATHVRTHDLGVVYTAPIGVVLNVSIAVQPDLVYVSRERAHLISERGIEGAPDLVVEVPSPSTRGRDRNAKLRAYANGGVPHYWIADPRARTLDPLRLGPTGYTSLGVLHPGDLFEPELFPGLKIPIDSLWP